MFLENSDVDVKTHFYFWNGKVLWEKVKNKGYMRIHYLKLILLIYRFYG